MDFGIVIPDHKVSRKAGFVHVTVFGPQPRRFRRGVVLDDF